LELKTVPTVILMDKGRVLHERIGWHFWNWRKFCSL